MYAYMTKLNVKTGKCNTFWYQIVKFANKYVKTNKGKFCNCCQARED